MERTTRADVRGVLTISEAIDLACRARGRPMADVRSAEFVSAIQIEAALAKDPGGRQHVTPSDPHWRIRFAGEEWIEWDEGKPAHALGGAPEDYLLVFADGAVKTHSDVTRPGDVAHLRRSIIDLLRLLADADAQLEYERSVPIANVPAELFCMWADDQYHPDSDLFRAAFAPDEVEVLAIFDEQFGG